MPLPYPAFKPCPCGSGRSYASCCEPAHSGLRPAQTPEQLMRSRYAAFVLQNEPYLLATWHPDQRPKTLHLNDGTRYVSLHIHAARENEVDFTVRLKQPDGTPYHFRERSRFVVFNGRWVYLDAAEPN